jgi:serine/threonine-protein kinase
MDFIALQTALAGQYFVEREIGHGGMGVVYLAREVRLERPVALKVLPPALAARPELRERFLREARTAAQLSHPHVVPIHRVDEAGPFVYLAMAYVDGGTVGDRLRERRVLPPEDVARLVREVGWALAYAHARGVIHRDVKPDNILLDRSSGRAMVTDFGIAHVTGTDGATGEGIVMGTAHYMSPEQASGESLDGRSDLYALGVVAYQALTGRVPFDAPTVHALLARHLTQPPPPLDGIAPRLERVILRCLEKSADDRPATGEALADLLDEATADRRALPAPLARWAEARDPLIPLYAAVSAVAGLLAVTNALQLLSGRSPITRSWSVVAVPALFGLAPIVPLVVSQLRSVYQALLAGYGLEDLRHALRRHITLRQRESTAEQRTVERTSSRLLRYTVRLAFAADATLVVAAALFGTARLGNVPGWVIPMTTLGTMGLWIMASALGITWPGRPAKRDHLARVRLAFLESPLGTRIVRGLANRARRDGAQAPAGRPTELAISVAADELFAALPSGARGALRDVPPVLRQLEQQAEAMRVRSNVLRERIADVDADAASPARDVQASVRAELCAARDAAERRRDDAIAALETLRLDLLRVQAGVIAPSSLTDLVARARALGDVVDARVAVGIADGNAIR